MLNAVVQSCCWCFDGWRIPSGGGGKNWGHTMGIHCFGPGMWYLSECAILSRVLRDDIFFGYLFPTYGSVIGVVNVKAASWQAPAQVVLYCKTIITRTGNKNRNKKEGDVSVADHRKESPTFEKLFSPKYSHPKNQSIRQKIRASVLLSRSSTSTSSTTTAIYTTNRTYTAINFRDF